ncbi:MAG: NAD(P)/FAD-dependent oxidoreductase [Christensenellales bacterium]|jgi:glycerol-3-phosphate dehydrogenase
MQDVIIIGGGVIGCTIARELSRYQLKVCVLEAGSDVASQTSKANSAIVHAGYDATPGSLMARFNVAGNARFDAWCDELDVPLVRCGSLVLAFDAADMEEVNRLYDRGVANGVPGMRILNRDEVLAMEPALNPEVVGALYAATGGITCPYELTIAAAENAVMNGAEVKLNWKVEALSQRDGLWTVSGPAGEMQARYVINAAGLFADEISALAGAEAFTVKPRKGEYMLLDRNSAGLVSTVIFQTPSKMGKGILVSPTVDGNLFVGPTAMDVSDKTDTATTEAGIEELTRLSRRSVPEVNLRSVITSFAGVRAVAGSDFIIGWSQQVPRLLNLGGICSPGLTSAPAIAEHIPNLLRQAGEPLRAKADFNPRRAHIARFRTMTTAERRKAIASNPAYGRIICRCETVTEAEIVQAMHRPVPALTLDAIKRRTRAGMGRCQGGFCSPRVMELLCRETGQTMEQLTKFGGGSYIVCGKVKEGK